MFSAMQAKAMCSTVCRLKSFIPAFLIILAVGSVPAIAGRLADSTSSYLAAHAGDAIGWQPWDGEALAGAERQDKLIFLTLGYAACHWCHVLARTTLKDGDVVETLGRDYVSILVDREERPDLDRHFSDVMLAMAGRSGYPALFILTPNGVPIFASGYLTAKAERGNPGLLEVLHGVAGAWRDERDAILADAHSNRTWMLDNAAHESLGPAEGAGFDAREDAVRQWSRAFDADYGGFGNEPKFLRPELLAFLLDEGVRGGDAALLEKVYLSLDQMAAGGVRDQLGGAFHRYAVDRYWQVPHFEIMLAENAWMALLYLSAYQASARPRYAAVAAGILDDLLRRMRLPGGAFAASLDAESGGEEGSFYTWTEAEIRTALGAGRAAEFGAAYLDPVVGLVRGRSVLRLLAAPETLMTREAELAAEREALRRARAQRAAPRRDDKMLTPWNAVTLMALAKAYQILNEQKYLTAAEAVLGQLMPAYPDIAGLTHSRRGARQSPAAFLDDYAFPALALLHLFEADFDVTRLDAARALMAAALEKFQAEAGMPLQLTQLHGPANIQAPMVLDEDGAPSANAAALEALYRLALFGAGGNFEAQAIAISANLRGYLERNAAYATGLLRALGYAPGEAREIVIAGDAAGADTRALLSEVYARPLRGTVVAVVAPSAPSENTRWPLLIARPLLAARATAYVCKNRMCDFPVDSAADLAAQLDALLIETDRSNME